MRCSLLWIVLTLSAVLGCGDTTTTIKEPPGNTDTVGGAGDTASNTDTGLCTAACDGKQCGPNGCGGFCGSCASGTSCTAGGVCQAPPECKPDCTGKTCGPDGCGKVCGLCDTGKSCNGAGQCTGGTDGCLPKCDGKECGDDGCGNACGKCDAGKSCVEGVCSGEASACGTVDEKGECQQEGGLAVTCKAGKLLAVVCDPAKGYVCGFNETKNKHDCVKSGCTPSCGGKTCGTDSCGGQCGQCKPDETCNANGTCQTGDSCQPACAGKTCGPDGCGSQCGICTTGEVCDQGKCFDPTDCNPNCSGKACGPDGCGGTCGTCKPGESCLGGQCDAVNCTVSCTGKACGDNGCGGSCGSCADAQICDPKGHCVIAGGGACGDLTYEGHCIGGGKIVEWCEGTAPKQQDCTALGEGFECAWVESQETYWCVSECIAGCLDKQCGEKPAGCSGTCGECPSGETCSADGLCVSTGGGGNCGTVTFIGECDGQTLAYCYAGTLETVSCGQYGKACGWDAEYSWYACVDPDGCIPNCFTADGDVRECGDDGCGNACGACADGLTCDAGACKPGENTCGDLDIAGKCTGDTLQYCLDGGIVTVDCAEKQQTCGAAGENSGYYDCLGGATTTDPCDAVPAQGACTAAEALQTCAADGSVKTTACSGGKPECQWSGTEYACAAKPAGCGTCAEGTRCQADGTCGCDNIDSLGQCEGSTLVYCLGTSLHIEDCATTDQACVQSGGLFICE